MEQQKDNRQGHQGQQVGQKDGVAQGYAYVVRKAEKLTTALYLVTDILSDKEPLKWKARESGVELLSDVSIASTASSSEKMTMLRGAIKKIERVVSFLDIAASSRMITEMNAGVLKREYLALRDGVEAEWYHTEARSKVLLSERFFDVPKEGIKSDSMALESAAMNVHATPSVRPTQPTQTAASTPPTHTPKPFVPSVRVDVPPRSVQSVQTQEVSASVTPAPSENIFTNVQRVAPVSPRPIVIDRQIVERPRLDDSRDDRRKIILALLRQKPAVTVGDIAKSISGVSEKTIQRELLAMVGEHILIKQGERRWSTYSLRIPN